LFVNTWANALVEPSWYKWLINQFFISLLYCTATTIISDNKTLFIKGIYELCSR